MTVIEKKYYVCEICGKTAQDEDKILQCQESHMTMINAEVEESYRKGKRYPQSVLFHFPDGSTVEYTYNHSTTPEGKVLTYEA